MFPGGDPFRMFAHMDQMMNQMFNDPFFGMPQQQVRREVLGLLAAAVAVSDGARHSSADTAACMLLADAATAFPRVSAARTYHATGRGGAP
jgi:hypothetical protein